MDVGVHIAKELSSRAAIERAARLHGIAPSYSDAWGKQHEVPTASLQALLAALGVDARDETKIEAAIQAAELARWRAVVPAVVVVRDESRPWSVRLSLRADAAATLRYRLVQEDGATHEENFAPASLAAIETAEVDGERFVARKLPIPIALPCGYHRLLLLDGDATLGEAKFIVAPARCYRPAGAEAKIWGAAIQLYGVRSEHNWGIGDFTDLSALLVEWGRFGAAIVGVNPLHALFPHDPGKASPYSPSSRRFFNVLYLDVEAVPDFSECEGALAAARSSAFQERLKALRETELVDYRGVAEVKLGMLERCFAHFRKHHLAANTARAQAFRAYQAAHAPALRLHALFEALQERFHREDPRTGGWSAWPEAYRCPGSPEVERFADEHRDRVEFFEYLQWQAELQLGAAGKRAMDQGLAVGLYADLAVSIDTDGAEAWANQQRYAVMASVGAPPDLFNSAGQNWGLPPVVPGRLREAAYQPFIEMLRANMRHAGALRIDHVMALARLFWVPRGATPGDGAYILYPFDDLVGIVALESHRNRCVVIGEDLGTVEPEFRAKLAAAGILSYKVLYFEHAPSGGFKPPPEYAADALVTATTHDLPTLAGFWEGRDLIVRHGLALFPSEEARQAQILARTEDRARLLLALEREDLLPAGATVDPLSIPEMTFPLMRNIYAFLARSEARVLMIQPEDILGIRDQVNLPGTVGEYPNWRRKIPLTLERWPEDKRFVAMSKLLAGLRPLPRPAASREVPSEPKIPRATYRLQLSSAFGFDDATRVVPYLDALGISHVYLSPILRARPGSAHGYDIVDHNEINPELGGAEGFERLCAALRLRGMGALVDMVPNHMGIMAADNAWWMDVLENGRASAFSDYFDIDWEPVNPELVNKVLVPVLGNHYGLVLEAGELKLQFEAEQGSFSVRYYENRFPVDPREYARILPRALELLDRTRMAPAAIAEAESLTAAFAHLPSRNDIAPDKLAERNRDKELHKRRLAALAREHPAFGEAIEGATRVFNGTPGERASFDDLDALLEAQAYALVFWRVSSDEINYRRFFDIDNLAALRMENEAVFEATHRFTLGLVLEGKIDGLRIDHSDGLYDPAQYFRRLQERYARLAGVPAVSEPHKGRPARPLYVVTEKIIARHEHVPTGWAIHGTTGYRFATLVNALFVDSAARARLTRFWQTFSGQRASFEEIAYRGKRNITRTALASQLAVLATELVRMARADRRTRDHTFNKLREAIAEVAACFPVYRTYITDRVSAQDRRYIDWAVAQARKNMLEADATILDFLRRALLASPPAEAPAALIERYRAFAMKFQQFTAPVAAKGVEDTAFYSYNRLVCLNEVGGDPDMFGVPVSAFHGASADRAQHWPHTMLATSTHDSKRSEDVRCRIDVISEMPAAWRNAVTRWSRMNAGRKRRIGNVSAPAAGDEYLLYQTLLGTIPAEPMAAALLPDYRERIERYMLKAVREAKLHSSWLNINGEYEEAVTGFVRALLGRVESNPFLDDLRETALPFAWFGMLNSLSMTLLKFTSPGVPDTYQGMEALELNLVDPDNRRPVDYGRRQQILEIVQDAATTPRAKLPLAVQKFFEDPFDGHAKFWLAWRTLALRREDHELFLRGDYQPVAVAGTRPQHVIAYARQFAERGVIVVAPRLFASLQPQTGVLPVGEQVWRDTALDLGFLPEGTLLDNVLTGEEILLGAQRSVPLFRALVHFPVGLFKFRKGT